jgi:hypothetical protein
MPFMVDSVPAKRGWQSQRFCHYLHFLSIFSLFPLSPPFSVPPCLRVRYPALFPFPSSAVTIRG